MNFFTIKNKNYFSMVFDIREFSLTVAVVKMINGKNSEIVSCQTFNISESEISSYKNYSESLIKIIDKAIIETYKSLIRLGIKTKINSRFFFVGSPWTISKAKSIKFIKNKNFSIDDVFLKRIFVAKEENLRKEIEKESEQIDLQVFEEEIIEAKLNGYRASSFYNRKAKEFEICLFTSFISKEINDKIKSCFGKKLKGYDSHLHSQTLSTFTFTRDLFQDKNNFIYVDIGNLVTDIYIVINDVIHGIASFPFGESIIINNIAKDLKVTKEIVFSTLNIKCNGKCDIETENKIDLYVNTGLAKWAEQFNETLSKICKEKDAPLEVIMMPNTDLIKNFVDKIKNNKSESILKIFSNNPELTIINEEILNNFVCGGNVFKNQHHVKMDIILLDKLIKQHNI